LEEGAGDFFSGPYLLCQWHSAQICHVFLEEKLPEMLEEIPLSVKRNMWFQYNMAADHFACQVQEHLITTYSDYWIA
jgi:hypothetical protein